MSIVFYSVIAVFTFVTFLLVCVNTGGMWLSIRARVRRGNEIADLREEIQNLSVQNQSLQMRMGAVTNEMETCRRELESQILHNTLLMKRVLGLSDSDLNPGINVNVSTVGQGAHVGQAAQGGNHSQEQ